jgi:hypothetical protein
MHDGQRLRHLFEAVRSGGLSVDEALAASVRPFIADVGSAKVDLDRQERCGFPEVVYCEGKSLETIENILRSLLEAGQDCFATRVAPEQGAHLQKVFAGAQYNEIARTLRIPLPAVPIPEGKVVVISAGTSDRPVAEEARVTAEWMGCVVEMIADVGVAGPHRLPAYRDRFADADAVVVVAGMEGALPSVVGGYVDCPVVGVPTSVGYGASFRGVAALLGMLNSCASNVTVVNIDSGFKGGYVAGLIARRLARARNGS